MSHIVEAIKKIGQAIRRKCKAIQLIRMKKTGSDGAQGEKKQAEAADSKKAHYTVGTENLAVPETHTGKTRHVGKKKDKPAGEKTQKPDIQYDSVAIPEIHFKKKKQ